MYGKFNSSKKNTTILLKEDAYRRLKSKGRFGESFSELVSRLLDEIEDLELAKSGVEN